MGNNVRITNNKIVLQIKHKNRWKKHNFQRRRQKFAHNFSRFVVFFKKNLHVQLQHHRHSESFVQPVVSRPETSRHSHLPQRPQKLLPNSNASHPLHQPQLRTKGIPHLPKRTRQLKPIQRKRRIRLLRKR